MRRTLLAVLGLVACAAGAERPDIIFILTDDMRASDLASMPNVSALMQAGGTGCAHYYDNVAICCPSRATLLRGQYSHNTHVDDNSLYPEFQRVDEPSTLATWLHAAGYRTGLFGKYLNAYSGGTGHLTIPAGWEEWCSPVAGDLYGQYNYTVNQLRDGAVTVVAHGSAPADYAGDVYGGKALDYVQRATAAHVPYFLYLALISPHEPATPAPRHANLFPGVQAPRSPNFDEADVSDKPSDIRALARLTPAQIATIDALYRKRLQSLQSVDELVRDLVATVAAAGRSQDTYIIFASDNGFHLGNHRMLPGKWTPYQEDTRVPLLVRGPGIAAGATIEHIVGNVDLAPTILDLAGVPAPALVDGRSIVPLLRGGDGAQAWRQAFLIEHAATGGGPNYPPHAYAGVHTGDHVYVEYATGERELYDLASDPFQLANIAADPAQATLIGLLSARVAELRGAQGAALRAAEQRSLLPHGGTPWAVPGRIQAEDFDEGGEGVAFHDADAVNHGGGYRDTAVDIRACHDVGGGWQVGWFGAGEWLAYTIDVPLAGAYDIAARVACGGAGASIHLECDGVDISGPLGVAPTGSWDTWRDVAKPAAALPGGVHVLRVVVDGGALDLNDLVLSAVADPVGVAARYCAAIDFSAPTIARLDPAVDFAWAGGSPDPAIGPDRFAARWSGEVRPRFSETYTFTTTSDDGVRLWVDGRLLIDHWSDHPASVDRATIALAAGHAYSLRMDLYEDRGAATAKLQWSSPSQALEVIPTAQLVPNLIANGGFEDGGAASATVGGWTSWPGADGSGAGADHVVAGDAHGGDLRLIQFKATAYEVRTAQVAPALAPGIYTLSAWVRSSGGQTACELEVSGFGGADLRRPVPATATWQRLVFADIRVTAGQCSVALHSHAAGGQWVELDDVRLLPAGVAAPGTPAGLAAGERSPLAPGDGARDVLATSLDLPLGALAQR